MINDLQPKRACSKCGDGVRPRVKYCEPCRKIATSEIHSRYRKTPKGQALIARQAGNREQWKAENKERMKGYRKDWKLKTYGITAERYAEMVAAQRGLCALCEKPDTDPLNPFVVDHDHDTEEIRGIVHRNCNSVLGLAGDDVTTLSMAVKYLMIRENTYA